MSTHQNDMQGKRFKDMIRRIGIKQAQFAREIDMDVNTVSRWAQGTQRAPGLLWAYLELRAKVKELQP